MATTAAVAPAGPVIKSEATTSLVAAIAGPPLALVGLLLTPVLVLSFVASVTAVRKGLRTLRYIKAGLVPESDRLKSFVGVGLGALGLVFEIGTVLTAVAVLGLIFMNL